VPKDTQMTISFLDELTMFLEDPQHSRDNHGSSSKKIVRKDFVVQSDEDEDVITDLIGYLVLYKVAKKLINN
jgi:hypothetical protein